MVLDGQINSFYGSISITKVVEDADSTNVEFTQLIHDSNNGTTFRHSTLTRKITNFTMKNTQTYYGAILQNKFKTVTFWDRNLRESKKWSH